MKIHGLTQHRTFVALYGWGCICGETYYLFLYKCYYIAVIPSKCFSKGYKVYVVEAIENDKAVNFTLLSFIFPTIAANFVADMFRIIVKIRYLEPQILMKV